MTATLLARLGIGWLQARSMKCTHCEAPLRVPRLPSIATCMECGTKYGHGEGHTIRRCLHCTLPSALVPAVPKTYVRAGANALLLDTVSRQYPTGPFAYSDNVNLYCSCPECERGEWVCILSVSEKDSRLLVVAYRLIDVVVSRLARDR